MSRVALLNYQCPDASEHGTYFDFSDDPEKAMRQELGGKQ